MSLDRTALPSRPNGVRHAVVITLLLVLAVVALLVLLPRAAAAGTARNLVAATGGQEFAENCVSCHGADGRGTGELAVKLVKPPKDLTAIAAANGGAYPFWKVFEIIAGETKIAGHDTHQMPDFFAAMASQDAKPGFLPAEHRVLALTVYLEGLQGK